MQASNPRAAHADKRAKRLNIRAQRSTPVELDCCYEVDKSDADVLEDLGSARSSISLLESNV